MHKTLGYGDVGGQKIEQKKNVGPAYGVCWPKGCVWIRRPTRTQPSVGTFLLPTEENVLNKSAMLSRHTDKEQAQTLAPSAAH